MAVTKQNLADQINQFIGGMNVQTHALRTNAQNHFDNSVRTLTESLRAFSIYANRAYYAVATDRVALQSCLVNMRDTMETVLETLRKSANSPIFDFSVSTETRIESDLKTQIEELKAAINSKTDAKCLSVSGITVASLNTKYSAYDTSLTNCINTVSGGINTDIVNKFNPEHFPALDLLNRIGGLVNAAKTRALMTTFVRKLLVKI